MAKTNGKVPPLYRDRLARCRRKMKGAKLGALLITRSSDARYLTGFTGEDSALLVTNRDAHLISDGRFDEAINQECPWTKRWMRKGTLDAEIAKVCGQLKLSKVGFQADGTAVSSLNTWKKLRRGTRFAEAPPILAEMRRTKDAAELKQIRAAIKIAQDAFQAMRSQLRTGMTELELAARLEFEMKQRGADGLAFPTIVAEGPNAALPHAHPGKRKVKKGSAILFDWGARVGGYCSDLTRLLFIDSIPRRMEAVYRVVLDAQMGAIKAARAGARLCDVDAVARDHIKAAGYGEAFNHGLGHGLGLDVHESPRVSWQSRDKLEAGSVVTIEPGIYLPRVGGVRIEDDIQVTKNGAKVLSSLPKKLEDCVVR